MLKTEMRNPKTTNIDKMGTLEMLKVIQEENIVAVNAVGDALPSIAKAVDVITEALKNGAEAISTGRSELWCI